MTEPAAEPVVEVGGLRVGYPGRAGWALQGIDLRIADGEQLLVVGPSGSGKSTLLHVLAGLVPRTFDADIDGDVRVGGHDPTTAPVPHLSRTVGLLRQDPVSQVALPLVEDELAFVLENRATAPEHISSRVDEALTSVGLSHLRGRRTATLSGGELQRVALAATLLGDPSLLILDEPTAMLDPEAAREVGELLTTATARRRASVLVEHRLADLPRLPDRVALLDRGGHLRATGATAPTLAAHAPWLVSSGSWLPLAVELGLATRGAVAAEDLHLDDAALLARHGPGLHRLTATDLPSRPTSGEVLVSVREASVRAADDGTTLVEGVDLDLRAGQVTAVIGANGSGKTSLLLGLAGFLPMPARRSVGTSVGMVFQHPEHQFVGRTVAEDLAHSIATGRRRRAHVDDPRVVSAVRRLGLAGLEGADPFRLSGGQKRRLSVASMGLTDHPVLLLDEPTFGQDRHHSGEVAAGLARLAADGRAVLFTTHDLRLAARIADRVVVLRDGRVHARGRPDEVLTDAGSLRDAGLRVPALLTWWAHRGTGRPVTTLLRGLDRAVRATADLAVAP